MSRVSLSPVEGRQQWEGPSVTSVFLDGEGRIWDGGRSRGVRDTLQCPCGLGTLGLEPGLRAVSGRSTDDDKATGRSTTRVA